MVSTDSQVAYSIEWTLRVVGAGTLFCVGIGLLCLLKFLVETLHRDLCYKTFEHIVLNGWRPGVDFRVPQRREWWWVEQFETSKNMTEVPDAKDHGVRRVEPVRRD